MAPDRHLGQRVAHAFHQTFGTPPRGLYRAPGRVNLIGEHTDYNQGFVLPMAIDRAVWLAAAPRADRQVRLVALSLDPGTQVTFSLDELAPDAGAPWSNYVRGVLAVLERHGLRLAGLDIAYGGDVPIGAGLSSSAAVEVAVATAANHLFGLGLDHLALARICQQAEHLFAGTQCGLMDQLISIAGQEGHALLIDCRSFEWQPVPLPARQSVVVCDTGKRRGLADSAYNERRAQCEEAARKLGVPALRDLDVEAFKARAGELPPLLHQRARHIVHENDRTVRAAATLRAGDLVTFGQLMNQSHTSLRDLYQVSSDELDIMAALAQAQPGCWGARMTGAGFGGCVVALVDDEAVAPFAERVAALYQRQTRIAPALYVTHPSAGAGEKASGLKAPSAGAGEK
ncbi:MAG: galactokinase [Anaerolineae bacterium]|nr:galactokinase [Anaerolineae bacterium]